MESRPRLWTNQKLRVGRNEQRERDPVPGVKERFLRALALSLFLPSPNHLSRTSPRVGSTLREVPTFIRHLYTAPSDTPLSCAPERHITENGDNLIHGWALLFWGP